MRNYIDQNAIKNEIRLLLKHPLYKDKVIIVVEGQSDVRLFRSILNSPRLKIETIDGKKDLISVMNDMAIEFPHKILAICDADHDHLVGVSEARKRYSIYVTDHHDAEIMMINSPSLESFLQEYSSFANITQLQSELLVNILTAAYPIGILRWINSDERLNIKFKGLNFNQFVEVNKTSVIVDIDTLIYELIRRSNSLVEYVNYEYLKEKLSEYLSKNNCKLQVCSGHDLTNIIAIIYRQKWASLETNMDNKKVESALRVGFQKSFFNKTELCKNILSFLNVAGIELQMC
ncbi:MAG: DUF4435 domain-containing protein [Pseudomonadota bacterium]